MPTGCVVVIVPAERRVSGIIFPVRKKTVPDTNGTVLTLAAVDRLHVQSVTQDKSDLLTSTKVGQPVPAEQTLDGDDQPVAEGRDRLQERLAAGRQVLVEDDLALAVEDAQVHGPGMEIDAAVESVRAGVETH